MKDLTLRFPEVMKNAHNRAFVAKGRLSSAQNRNKERYLWRPRSRSVQYNKGTRKRKIPGGRFSYTPYVGSAIELVDYQGLEKFQM
ncbi:hypothetical protein AYI69_g4958 [Smittium culicis]|uniref:Uncharacterized protein n=1 Tax=Smittium culicis TaxID=133412 RepID=A0A1R1Y955_9FUNG|nr:hypothetical protein AYI69_g4958 [Smittium culicis]